MDISAAEISDIIRKQIENYDKKVSVTETGTVLTVGDGIARVSGLPGAMAGELLEFEGAGGEKVSGMVLKEEPRQLVVVPRRLRISDPERDERNDDRKKVELRFGLPRGAYATMLIKHLFAAAASPERGGRAVRDRNASSPRPTRPRGPKRNADDHDR